jgi:hypothetical protein
MFAFFEFGFAREGRALPPCRTALQCRLLPTSREMLSSQVRPFGPEPVRAERRLQQAAFHGRNGRQVAAKRPSLGAGRGSSRNLLKQSVYTHVRRACFRLCSTAGEAAAPWVGRGIASRCSKPSGGLADATVRAAVAANGPEWKREIEIASIAGALSHSATTSVAFRRHCVSRDAYYVKARDRTFAVTEVPYVDDLADAAVHRAFDERRDRLVSAGLRSGRTTAVRREYE